MSAGAPGLAAAGAGLAMLAGGVNFTSIGLASGALAMGEGEGARATVVGLAAACGPTARARGISADIMLMPANLVLRVGENKSPPRNFRPVFMNIGSALLFSLS